MEVSHFSVRAMAMLVCGGVAEGGGNYFLLLRKWEKTKRLKPLSPDATEAAVRSRPRRLI